MTTAAQNNSVALGGSRVVPLESERAWRLVLPLHIVLMALVLVAALMAISLRLHEPDASHDRIAVACGLAVAAMIVYARHVFSLPWISASVVYLILFWMFHYGLAFTAVAFPNVLTSPRLLASAENWETDIGWLYWPNVRMSMILGVIGAAGFMSGISLTCGRSDLRNAIPNRNAHDSALYLVGWLVLLAGVGGVVAAVIANGGVYVLAMGYQEFRDTFLGPTKLQSAVDVSQLGCLLAICGAGGRRWISPLVLWNVTVGMLMLVSGLRNEALVPFLSFVVVLRYRGVRLHRGLLVGAVVAALMVVPLIKAIRDVGVANRAQVEWTNVSPLETLTELGGTLRAIKTYVDIIERGDEYLLGASYWAPFDRQILVRLVPGREQIPYDQDERLPGRLVPTREGAVGTAATGEAYSNFGSIGPFVFFVCVGVLFGWLERRAVASAYGCASMGVVMILFYFNIRGEWLQVPAQIGVALTALAACRIFAQLAAARRAWRLTPLPPPSDRPSSCSNHRWVRD